MATIVVSPQASEEESDSELVELTVVVTGIEDLVTQFDQIEVWRSKDGAAGPYEELTAEDWVGPRLPKTAGDDSGATGAQVYLVGLELELRLNEDEDLSVIFTGSDPLTLAEAASQIEAQTTSKVFAHVDGSGTLVVESALPGAMSALRVVGGDAAAVLELPLAEPGSVAYGKDPRLALVAGTTTYSFTDGFGASSYYYRTRYRNSSTGATSAFSQPFSAGSASTISPAELVIGKLDVVDSAGRPCRNVEVRMSAVFDGVLINGRVVVGRGLVQRTDANGHVEFHLVRGQKMTVAIVGTDITREITVPTDPSIVSFNLLDASVATGDDVFKVAVPVVVTAERRSL